MIWRLPLLCCLLVHCGSSEPSTPTTTNDAATTGDTSTSPAIKPCLHDKDGSRYDCQNCTANCQFLKDWCNDGELVDSCPTDNVNGTCKDADPVGIGTKLDVIYYKNATLTGAKPQCDILKGTWQPL